MKETTKTILIAGYYGFKNTGDEAILTSMLHDLRSMLPGIDFIVVSGDPQYTKDSYGVDSVSFYDIQAIVKAVDISHFVILGGGGLFHDYWSFDPNTILTPGHAGISFYASVALLAPILNKPLMLYSVGVGPLFSEMGKFYTGAIVKQACIVTVRDDESKRLLTSLGINPEHIHVTADPAFRLSSIKSIQPDKKINSKIFQNRPVLGVVLRSWDVGVEPETWERQVAEAIDDFVNSHDANVVFIPFQRQVETSLDDASVSERIRQNLQKPERASILGTFDSPADKMELIARCDLLLGMRLHAIIFAICRAIPFVGLVYDPKVQNIINQAGIENCAINLGEITSQSLVNLLEQTYKNRVALTNQMRSIIDILDEEAMRNAELAVDILEYPSFTQKPTTPTTIQLLKQVVLSLSQALETQAQGYKQEIAELHAELESEVAQRDQIITKLKTELETQEADHEQEVRAMELQSAEKDKQIVALNKQVLEKDKSICSLDAQLKEIKGSRGWRLVRVLWQIRLFLIPKDSWRERIVRKIWHGLQINPSN